MRQGKRSPILRASTGSARPLSTTKAKYGGLEVSEAQRLRQLEEENRRLKHLVADLSLDKEALKAVVSKNEWSSQLNGKCRLCCYHVRNERTKGLRAARSMAVELPLPTKAGSKPGTAGSVGSLCT